MVRKQVYLRAQQAHALQRRAHLLGISEAEVVRRALDTALGRGCSHTELARRALEEFRTNTDRMLAEAAIGPEYRFHRNAIYDKSGRVARWIDKD